MKIFPPSVHRFPLYTSSPFASFFVVSFRQHDSAVQRFGFGYRRRSRTFSFVHVVHHWTSERIVATLPIPIRLFQLFKIYRFWLLYPHYNLNPGVYDCLNWLFNYSFQNSSENPSNHETEWMKNRSSRLSSIVSNFQHWFSSLSYHLRLLQHHL